MGIAFVLFFGGIVLGFLALIIGAVLWAITRALTSNAGPERRRVVRAAAILPMACVLYAGVWFCVYTAINTMVFHRDPGVGDIWRTPLPNAYALLAIDSPEQGIVYNPKTQPDPDSVASQDDAMFGVYQLQISASHILGARHTGALGPPEQEPQSPDSYFDLDTTNHTLADFATLQALRQHAADEGITLNLRDFPSFFSDYRYTRFDVIAVGFPIFVPFAGFLALARWVWNVTR